MEYNIHFGFDRNGRVRNRYAPTLEQARKIANDHFRRTGIVLSIVAVPERKTRKAKQA